MMIDAANYVKTEILKNGESVEIRSICPDDKSMITEAFQNLEPESIYTRFFYQKRTLTQSELNTATEVDFEDVVALVVTAGEEANKIIIGGGRYVVLDNTESQPRAEVAFTVEEDYHGQGIASLLLKHLARIARSKGLSYFIAEVLPKNRAMLKVFSRSGLPMKQKSQDGVVHISLSLNG